MKFTKSRKSIALALAAVAISATLNGAAMTEYDFEKAWNDINEAQRKRLPRTVTNKLEEIAREAAAAQRWPDAAQAFLARERAMGEFTDEQPADWLPAFAASVDAQPAPLQAVLQLHLAHTYLENSRRRRWGGSAPTKLDDAAAKDKMPPWAPEKINATLEAQFEKVLARSDELKKLKTSDWTALFSKGTVPDSYCPTLFDFAVKDMIEFYGSSIPDKTLEKGLALYDLLMQFHRADGNIDALAMAEINRAEYVKSFSETPEKKRITAFVEAMNDIMARFEGKTETVAFAAANKAQILCAAGERVAAHDLAADYAAKWPDALGGKQCANIVSQIESKELAVKVERNWCAPLPQIEVSAKNIEEVFFRLVPVAFKDLVNDTSMGSAEYSSSSRSALRGDYLKRTPAKEWKQKLDLKRDYATQAFSLSAPADLKPGHYVLYAAGNDKFGADKEPLYCQFVTVTSLALVLEAGNGEFRGTVYSAESGLPSAGARVELWGPPKAGGRFKTLRETYTTDANGRFVADVPDKNDYNSLSRNVRVVKDGDEVLSLETVRAGSVYDEKQERDFVDIFTDRSLYRPGQTINVKGIAYHADPHTRDFHTHVEKTVVVTLSDPNGKEISSKKLETNKWGSFVQTFSVPAGLITGTYTITARIVVENAQIGKGRKSVNVEEYKRPKFAAELEKAPDKATLGEQMTITGKATTYSGLPVQNAKVEWHVERTTHYPDWWRWLGFDSGDDGDSFVDKGEAKTDENGTFKITFTPVASPTADLSGDPSFTFSVTATVTDGTGEARSAQDSFEIGTVVWRANVWVDGNWHPAGAPVCAKVSLASLAGTKVPVKGTLKAFRLKQPDRPVRKPLRERHSWDNRRNGPWNWKKWEAGEEVLSVEANGEDSKTWTTGLKLDVGAYRLVFEAKDPNGKMVKDMTSVCVFDTAKPLGITAPDFFCVEKTCVKAGETLRAYWGTGYESGYCRIVVKSNGKTILDKPVNGDEPFWFYELPLKDEHRGEMRVEKMFVRENRIYYDYHVINVPWDNKYLDVTAEHLTSKLNPGREETWKFKVSGPAEVLAFMYDKSLDAYKWHDVSLNFSSHFTPWEHYLSTPQLQNEKSGLACLGGAFPLRFVPAQIMWPEWRSLGRQRSYGMKCGSILQSAGTGGLLAEEMVAYEREEPVIEGAGRNAVVGNVLMLAKAPAGMPPAGSDVAGDGDSSAGDVPRRNLQETAFFFPDLETDAAGNVSLSFTVPDALTGWKLLMVAHDNVLDGGIFRKEEIVTTKPLMCEPNAPRFAREGDDFLFAVKVTNTEETPQSGEVSLEIEERKMAQPFSLAPHESRAFEFRVAIPDGCGYLKYIAKAKGEAFSDGEEGILPVLSRSILVREAVQLNARGRETKSFKLENLMASKGSDTIRHHDLTVRAVSRPAWYAVLSLPYLMEFPHECCEQTFSRYYANALGAFIANSDPRVRETFDAWKAAGAEALKSPLETDPHLKAIALEATPWVREAEHENAARARLGDMFGDDRLKNEQARCIEKLRRERNGDGRWPWFPGGISSDCITLYILTGFARINHLAGIGYPDFFASAAAALDAEVAENVKYRLEKEHLPFRIDGFDIRWLYLHSFKGVAPARDKTLVPLFVKHLRDEWPDMGLETQALAAIALGRMDEKPLAREIMASIKERAVLSDELGMYWKRPYFFSSSVFAAPVSTQAIVVEAFREVAGDDESADACNVWLLKQKQTQDWTTTAATADAIYALLLGGKTDLLACDSLAEVALGGEKVKPENAEAGTGMYSVRHAADSIRPEMGEITFTGASEKGVSWGGVHWSYFEDVLKVRAHEPKELRVEKKYYKKIKGAEGTRLTAIDGVLEPGDEIVARLEIASDRTYEFVHISDGRPACAEPVDVLSSYRWQDGVGYYQSTRDTATHYYIDRLNKGTFVLETSFRVQQRGVFVGGIATIQCMYAPEFTAHSTAETVRVGK